jgi:nucleotide-binding universal stress UspA family protein
MVRSMLYATDLGVYAPLVLQHALAMAKAFMADLYVIHVVEPMGSLAQSVLRRHLDEAALASLQRQSLPAVMESIEDSVFGALRAELGEGHPDLALVSAVRVRQGDPWEVSLEQARELNVGLVVLGSHGHGGCSELPLGRTAARVLQLSPVPVYLVPLLKPDGRGRG